MRPFSSLLIFLVIFIGEPLSAAPDTGKEAAAKYFSPRPSNERINAKNSAGTTYAYARQIGLSAGTFFQGKSYQWLGDEVDGWAMQLDYRGPAEPGDFIGQGFRLGFQKFQSMDVDLSKISLLWSLTFPARVSFPVYIGANLGPGFFLRQIEDESWLTLDYQAYLGLRLNSSHSQFFIESGMKNHLLVLSNGQFSGWFVASGVAYKF